MPIWAKYLLCCLFAYLLGSVNFAVIIAKCRKQNIKKEGSGNPGTMNMLRSVGKFWGCLTFVLDFLKGVTVSLVGMYVLGDGVAYSAASAFPIYLLGLCAIIGHVFPIFMKFKGGKGVATSIGVFGVGDPIGMLVGFVLLMIYLFFSRIGFLGSLLLVFGLTIADSVIYRADYRVAIILVFLSLLITFTHRANIMRLCKGKENSLSLFKSMKKPKTAPSEVTPTGEEPTTNNDIPTGEGTPTDEGTPTSEDIPTDKDVPDTTETPTSEDTDHSN